MKSHDGLLRFGDFTLDPANRRLLRGGAVVELGGRYLDALILFAHEPGQLITKDRLHEEVWRGVPVTDEALSQAIMALRRALGDDAARPRYIETVPRHGYRFIAPLLSDDASRVTQPPPPARAAPSDYVTLRLIAGGIIGAAVAGALVGLAYGSLAAGEGAGRGLSLVLVLVTVCVLAALVSALGIATGIGLATRAARWRGWHALAGGALGGLVIGGFARLLGSDALRLLVGSAPERIAGAWEGLAIGIATGLGYWLSRRGGALGAAAPALLGGAAGSGIILSGGTLMAGSLAALTARFPNAGLGMGWTGDPLLLTLSGAFEGALFTAALAYGLTRARASH
ncbi:winged helix-turn-helix domain-containing protein [Qipengyuania sediminis]|uniref:winged helix-turn-helix domain-containing protein n=1 Tax=Qipengyuania sediminis TaxID=1532023 RepID=UPI001059DB1D|nr:transcriptional regulator [Qipengyuania sediminis]